MSRRAADQERRKEFNRGFAKRLRADMTKSERNLWALLRNKQITQMQFRRQQPIGPYIADFFCPAAKLIVELDGDQHGSDAGIRSDEKRTIWLQQRGYQVLRFSNSEFLKDPQGIIGRIAIAAESRLPLPEPPLAVRPSLKGRVE